MNIEVERSFQNYIERNLEHIRETRQKEREDRRAKIVELSGDPCETVDMKGLSFLTENRSSPKKIASIILRDPELSSDGSDEIIRKAVSTGRKVMVIDIPKAPEGWEHLRGLYSWLPAALFSGYRHTTIGEPMFRGGFDPDIFIPTYFSPIEEM